MERNKATNFKRVINNYSVGDEAYTIGTIVANGETYYVAIDHKYLDENGYLTQQLNGLQMHMEKDLYDCLSSVRISYRMRHGESEQVLAELKAGLK
jgi:hypothetical protein